MPKKETNPESGTPVPEVSPFVTGFEVAYDTDEFTMLYLDGQPVMANLEITYQPLQLYRVMLD